MAPAAVDARAGRGGARARCRRRRCAAPAWCSACPASDTSHREHALRVEPRVDGLQRPRLRTITAAPMSRTTESATSHTTSRRRVRMPEGGVASSALLERVGQLGAPGAEGGQRCRRGAGEDRGGEREERARDGRCVISSARGTWSASSDANASQAGVGEQHAGGAARRRASTSDSIRSCWKTRARLARGRRASRAPCGGPRARVKSRLPTFAQAMSSTSPTAASSITSVERTSPTITSRSGTSVAPQPAFSCGYSCSSRFEMTSSSDSACVDVDPGREPGDRLHRCGSRARHGARR